MYEKVESLRQEQGFHGGTYRTMRAFWQSIKTNSGAIGIICRTMGQGFTQPLCGASCPALPFSKLEFVDMHFNLHSYDPSRGSLGGSYLLVILINIIWLAAKISRRAETSSSRVSLVASLIPCGTDKVWRRVSMVRWCSRGRR